MLSGWLAALPVAAQVIEIDAQGMATTYDGPTLFVGNSVTPVRGVRVAPLATPTDAGIYQDVARVHGLPPALLAAVAWQESRGRSDAVSPKGAIGVMQLMPETARRLGVDPHDRDANIRGGARYLRQQIDRFGSVPLALAAYNAGPGAVIRYGGIPPYRETRTYVASILARLGGQAAQASSPIESPLLIEVANP
jgi:soluble lytic murein transglycosylase-like protein